MTDAIVSFAVKQLGDFLTQEIVDRKNLRTRVEWLRNELGYMQSFIQDAEEKQSDDHRMQQWISEITDIAHNTVAILKDCNLKVGAPKSGFFNSLQTYACLCSREANLHNISQQLESLKQRVLDISRKRETYGIRNLSNSAGEGANRGPNSRSIIKRLRRATSYVDQDRLFVGFEDVTRTLLAELFKMECRRSVISIYGMGGLGKTTVARELYNSSKVMENFRYRAWVCVSQEYSTSDLLRTLIKSFRKRCFGDELKIIEKMDEEDLERYLREILKGHKYLAVVDDVWHKEAWESLKRAFPDDKNGSRVIITTRKKDVATRVDDRSFVHELRFLTPDESWDLFCKKISHGDGYNNWCSAGMLDLGGQMVHKCGGLPLAIVVLGGLLCHKERLQEWHEVKEHIWRHLKNDSLEISFLLSLSYDDLSGQLKHCFLYLGSFLEDSLIDVEKLKWLWMAEGFITPREAKMEEVADHYLNELVNRSMIQIADKMWDKIAYCRIHDLLRDLAVQKAIEVNFFDIYDPRKYSTANSSGRRQVVHTQIRNYFSLVSPSSKMQSLVIFNPDGEEPKGEHFRSLCVSFTNLHVLYLENCHFNFATDDGQLPYDIGSLIHLKFLGIVDTNFRSLPRSLGKLRSLETLCAATTDLAFPPEISELTNLRHLVALCKGPVNISSLTNLETLKFVKYQDWLKLDTTNLVNLRELVVQKIDGQGSLDSIGKLRNLATLTLTCSAVSWAFPPLKPLSSCKHLLRLWLSGPIKNVGRLKWLPRSIMILTLQHSILEQDPMPLLETFPNLQSLELIAAYIGHSFCCTAKGFPELELLRFRSLYGLEWHMEEGAMPMLKGVGIYKCPGLKCPERINRVRKLKETEKRLLPYERTWA
ncbi:unnamed protein product [Coffea canephora]|uniref:AAA+ ATPase domain-containing protein n=1 Tax=Coffea canephora TaxID=49390 RepID=A0A068TQI0_COFCA|nr:unnamed protein product [Coffea canephora]